MANPAELLHNTFEKWNAAVHEKNSRTIVNARADNAKLVEHRRAVIYLNEIEHLLNLMKKDGKRVDSYIQRFPGWTKVVFNYGSSWSSTASKIDGNLMGFLETLIDAMDPYVPAMDEDKLQDFKTYLDLVEQTLKEDDSLSDVVVKTSLAFVQNLKTNIDNYAVVGDFRINEALQRLLGQLADVTLRSSHQDKWREVLDKFFFPYAVNQAPGLPGGGLLTAITSGGA